MAQEVAREVDWRVDFARSPDHSKTFDLEIFGHVLRLTAFLNYQDNNRPASSRFWFSFVTEWKDPEVNKYLKLQSRTISHSGYVIVSRHFKRRGILRHIWYNAQIPYSSQQDFNKATKHVAKRVYFVNFRFRFTLGREGETSAAQPSTMPTSVVPPTRPVRIASPFLNDTIFSDVAIVCRDQTFPCHKVILAGASNVFMTMLTGNFREALENHIDISCFNVDTVSNLIRFIYEDNIPEEAISWELFEAAKMYEVRGLEKACLFRLRMNLDVTNCCRMLEAASKHDLRGLFTLATRFTRENKEEVLKTEGWKRLRKINRPLAKRLKRLQPLQKDLPVPK